MGSNGVVTHDDIEARCEELRSKERDLKRQDAAIWADIREVRAELHMLVGLQRSLKATNGKQRVESDADA